MVRGKTEGGLRPSLGSSSRSRYATWYKQPKAQYEYTHYVHCMEPRGKRKPTVSFRLPAELLLQVDELVAQTGMRSRTELIERALESCVDELKEAKVVRVQPYSEAEARAAILRYLEDRPGTYVSELAEALAMDVELAFRVVTSLTERGKVRG